ncbi:MAG: DUF371 domain-containing protein [Candidatus Heimdallarchaeaceae archaeon]
MDSASFTCRGHKNIISTHKSTMEFTTDSFLSLKGDCIVGVNSSLSLKNLPEEFKEKIRRENSQIKIVLQIGEEIEEILGHGNPNLQLSDSSAIIVRKSAYTCPKTLAIKANKAACNISKDIIEKLKNSDSQLKVTIYVEE